MAAGTRFWVPHQSQAWVPGKLTASGGKVYETDFGDVTVPAGTPPLEEITDEGALVGVNDCCVLDQISQASILHTIRVRKARGEIYTNISTVLIAINPFKPLAIYSSEYVESYRTSKQLAGLPPHIFGIGAAAFEGLIETCESQAMLVSGESGAGKTESMKLLLLYTSEVLSGQEGGLEDMVLEINPILEAFGNARTVRNNNSSRFGKWIEVQVDPGKRTLRGASITDYLLEVTRVCSQGPGERNYHICYQLAADESIKSLLKLDGAEKFKYLCANPMTIPGVNDQKELGLLRQALVTLNFTAEEIMDIFKVVSAVLHIGNLDFVGEDSDAASIAEPAVLADASELLMVDADGLSKCICFKRIATGRDVVESPLDCEKARQARDSIAKMIYSRLFKWLVARCNAALGEGLSSSQCEVSEGQLFFGILDIAGFESFETNKLEQLLINLSNEKLHQFFISTVFKSELAEYTDEGISVSNIEFADNADVLALIESKDGILSMLDDATTGVKQTDASFSQKLISEKGKDPRFVKPKFTGDLSFGVKHYAGNVVYSTEGFLIKNFSTQPPEVLELMGGSQIAALREMAKEPETADSPKRGGGKSKATVSSGFRRSLQQLIEKLSKAHCQFVRCIKPNQEHSPTAFDAPMVLNQLRLGGVMETVEIRKAGFLVRQRFLDFVKRYLVLVPKAQQTPIKTLADANDVRQATGALLKDLDTASGTTALGNSKVFIKAHLYRDLEDRRRNVFEKMAPRLQGLWRGYRTRKNMKEVVSVDRELKECMTEAGCAHGSSEFSARHVERATWVCGSLDRFDLALMRAMHLPIQLSYIPEATKVRAHLAAEADLAKKMVEMKKSIEIPELQAVIAHAGNYKIAGPLVDALNQRLDLLKEQMPQRRALQNCVSFDQAGEVRAVVETAQKAGLDQPDKWLLPDGADAFAAATARLDELEAEVNRKEAFLAEQIRLLEECMTSVDLVAIQEALATASSNGIRGEAMNKLEERHMKLERQSQLIKSLENCKEYTEPEIVENIIEKVRAAGLDNPDKWLFDDGPRLLDVAQAHLEKVSAQKKAQDNEIFELEVLLEDMSESSQDVPAMRVLIARAKGRVKDEYVAALEERCSKVVEQTPYRRALRNCDVFDDMADVKDVLERVAAAGLNLPENWILHDGPQVYARAVARAAGLENILAAKARIARAAAKFSAMELEAAISAANELGILESEYARAHRLFIKLQSVEEVRKLISENQAGGTEEALANLQQQLSDLTPEEQPADSAGATSSRLLAQLRGLESSCDVAAMQAVVARAEQAELTEPGADDLLAAVKKRCAKLQRQHACLKSLEDCATSDDTKDISNIVEDAKSSTLDDPTKWLLATGPVAYTAAVSRLQYLEKQLGAAKRNLEEIRTSLEELSSSFDIPAMKLMLERAAKHGVTGDQVDTVQQRVRNIQKQSPIEKLLRNCAVYDDLDAVRGIHAKAVEAGLDSPEAWLLPRGAEAFAQAVERMKNLEDLAQEAACQSETARMERQMKGLMSSLDVPAIQQALARGKDCGVRMEISIRLRKRCEALQVQMPIHRALKNCLFFDEIPDVEAIIQQVQAAGLDDPDQWLWPDGPKLYTRALALPDHLRKVEAIRGRIKNAVQTYDVKELRATFNDAEAIEMPEYAYRSANKLYVDLQSPDFVEAKLQELQGKGGNDPLDLLATTNLMEQLKALGLKVDSKHMQDAASRMARGRKKSMFESSDETERELARKVFDDLANYSQLRDPLTWGSKGLWATVPEDDEEGTDLESRARVMLQYTSERIAEPLTTLEGNADLEQAALKNFWNLLRCLGDKPSAFIADKEGPILKTAKRPALCDEVYIQIMKQLTGNPSSESALHGWRLLRKLVKETLPSAELCEFFRAFLIREAGRKPSPKKGAQQGALATRRKSRCVTAEKLSPGYAGQRATFLNDKVKMAGEILDVLVKMLEERE